VFYAGRGVHQPAGYEGGVSERRRMAEVASSVVGYHSRAGGVGAGWAQDYKAYAHAGLGDYRAEWGLRTPPRALRLSSRPRRDKGSGGLRDARQLKGLGTTMQSCPRDDGVCSRFKTASSQGVRDRSPRSRRRGWRYKLISSRRPGITDAGMALRFARIVVFRRDDQGRSRQGGFKSILWARINERQKINWPRRGKV